MAILPLHAQFDIIRLKLHLRKNPEESYELAVGHYQDYLEVVERYKQLEAENKKLKSVSLPPFGTPSHGQLQRQYQSIGSPYKLVEVIYNRCNYRLTLSCTTFSYREVWERTKLRM